MLGLTYEVAIDTLFVGANMETVKVSPKFQVVIPKKVREELHLKPGQELNVYIMDGTIRFSKPRPITELRVDRRVSDGKIYIASGLTANDIELLKKDWPARK